MTPQNDRLDFPWFLDKAVAVLVFIGGISAIVFIIAIFVLSPGKVLDLYLIP